MRRGRKGAPQGRSLRWRIGGSAVAVLLAAMVFLVARTKEAPAPVAGVSGRPMGPGVAHQSAASPPGRPARTQARPAGVQPAAVPAVDGADPLGSVLAPVQQAAAVRGDDLSDILPTAAELAAARAEGGVDGPLAAVVLDKLRVAYARYDMPFPQFAPGPAGSGSGDPQAVQAWLEPTVAHLRERLLEEDGDLALLPTAEAQAAAIASGRMDSAPTLEVVADLRAVHGQLGIPFTAPAAGAVVSAPAPDDAGPAPSPPPNPSQAGGADSAQQAILRAYFRVQVDRIRSSAAEQGRDPGPLVPGDPVVQAAIDSADIRSEASGVALDALRAAHQELGLQFIEPVAP